MHSNRLKQKLKIHNLEDLHEQTQFQRLFFITYNLPLWKVYTGFKTDYIECLKELDRWNKYDDLIELLEGKAKTKTL